MQTLTANNLYNAYQDMAVVEQKKFYNHFKLLINKQANEEVLGYEMNGTPITRAMLELQLQESMRQVEAGNFTTNEELDKEMLSW